MMLSDVSESVKASGEATVPSVPIKPVNQTSVSSGDEKAGDVSSVKSEVLSAASSGPSKSIGKAGVSAGLNIGAKYKASVSSRDKGKAIVGKAITFRDVILYLPKPVFARGQLYVALSRVTSKAGLTIIKYEDSHQLRIYSPQHISQTMVQSNEEELTRSLYPAMP
ncbi:hypothetical protein F2Q70_00042862 [Brassica cretica]|uniref:Uncharacterized protein n=1 Tax=Brassica cretica TaxID=69181 RepID=A0A8S9KI23_BRACR|nr:hypothetical protein F2Q70_00042862 [Brassica cretica]